MKADTMGCRGGQGHTADDVAETGKTLWLAVGLVALVVIAAAWYGVTL
jgi:hypothetical protein